MLRSGATSVVVQRDDGWIVASADEDWLHGDVAAFFSPQSYSEGGRTSPESRLHLRPSARQSSRTCSRNARDHLDGRWRTSGSPALDAIANLEKGRAVAFSPRRTTTLNRRALPASVMPAFGGVGEGERDLVTAVESFVAKQREPDDRTP